MLIALKDDRLELAFTPRGDVLAAVRALPSRRFDGDDKWVVPHTRENWAAMQARPDVFPLDGIPAPRSTGYTVEVSEGLLRIRTPWSIGNRDAMRNLQHLRAVLPQAVWDAKAELLYQELVIGQAVKTEEFAKAKNTIAEVPLADDYKHGGPMPWMHQRQAFALSRDRTAFALFMEMRTGKSKVLIDTACWNYIHGKIRQVLVISPNNVKTLWVTDELPTHMPGYIPWTAAYWSPAPTRAERNALDDVLEPTEDRLCWLSMNVEAFSTDKGYHAALKFVKSRPTAIFLDESPRIKTPGAKRTRAVIKLGAHAVLRRIATGQPVEQGPLDTYTQGKFLDPDILGFGSFYAFRNHFAVMGGWNGKEVIAYSHLDELRALWDPHSFRVTRDECFDIPQKGYQKLIVDMTAEQTRVYRDMAVRMRAEVAGQRVTATIALTQMLRLAQIAGGFIPPDLTEPFADTRAHAIPGGNPKIAALLELVEDVQGKILIWARFRAELAAIAAALRKAYGDLSVVEFHGGVDDDGRIAARTAFQDSGSAVRFFVGQTDTGGMGLNLSQARTIVYFSNSFNLGSRVQSEDRASSSEQKHSVAVVDIIARDTIDDKVVTALRDKQDIARLITGDAFKAWI